MVVKYQITYGGGLPPGAGGLPAGAPGLVRLAPAAPGLWLSSYFKTIEISRN